MALFLNYLLRMDNISGVHSMNSFRSELFLLIFALLITTSSSWCFDTQVTQFKSAEEIDFSPNNIHFLSVDRSNSAVNIWRIDTKSIVFTYYTTSPPKTAKFSKDGIYIGIGMVSGNITILTAATMTPYGGEIQTLIG